MALGPAEGTRGQPTNRPWNSRPALDGVLSAHRGYKRGLRVPGAGAGWEDGDDLREDNWQAGPHAEPYTLRSFGRTRVSVRGPMWE